MYVICVFMCTYTHVAMPVSYVHVHIYAYIHTYVCMHICNVYVCTIHNSAYIDTYMFTFKH